MVKGWLIDIDQPFFVSLVQVWFKIDLLSMHTSSHCIANLNASMRNIFCLPIAIWSTNDGMCIHTTSYHLRLEFSISAKRNSQNFIMMSSLLLDFHMVLIYLYSAKDIPLCCMQYSNLHIWLLLKNNWEIMKKFGHNSSGKKL